MTSVVSACIFSAEFNYCFLSNGRGTSKLVPEIDKICLLGLH